MSSNFDWEKIKENASGRTGNRNEIKNVALRNNGFDWDKIKANASERKIIPVQTVDSENIVNRAAHEVVSNQQSYEEQKQSLKEQKSAANKDRFSAALSYLSDKLSGENTDVSERKYETAKRKYSDIKSDLDNLKKNKWNQTQTDNETVLNENADLSELVKKAYESKLLIDSSDNAKQMNNTAGQNNFLADVLYPNANQSDKYHSNYQKYLEQIKELGYDADSLIDTYSRMQNKQTSQQIAENTAEFADKHPVLASGAYVAANAFQAPALEDTIKTGLEAKVSGDYKPIDVNAPSFFATNVRDTISGQVTGNVHQSVTDKANNETLADAAAFLYQTGLSMGDFASVAALPQPASLAIMGTSAAASTAKEATERGVSADKAALTAIAAGGAEIVFEKLSLENLSALKATGRSGVVNTVKDILKQSFTEGSEEVFTDIANAITDQIINGDDSALQQQYRELINNGMNENDARKQTAASFGRQIGESFLGGAISGGVMGTGGVAVGNVKQNADYRRVGNEIKNTGIAQNVINEGLDAPIGSNTQRAAAQLQNKLNGINVDNNTKDVAASMLSSRQLGKLQLANQNTVAKENLVNAVSSDPDSKLLTKAMTNVAEGRKISHLEFEAIKNSDTAINAINSEYGTSFTKDNIKRNILDNVSIISSRTLYSPSNSNAPTAEQTRINIANKIRERQQQANDNKPTENAKTNIKYNIEATDFDGNAVTINDISTDNGKLFVTTDNNMTVPADNLNIVNDNQKNLLKFAGFFPTDTAKSFVAGFEYNSNQNVGDYAEGFQEIYKNTVSTKTAAKMSAEQAIYMGDKFGLTPEQSFIAYSTAQNSISKSDSKVASQTANVQNNGTQTAVHNTSAAYPLKNTIQKQKTDIAQQKKDKQAKLETALKSNSKGAVTVGTPKTSMQKAEIELLDSFAKDKGLSVIVVDSVRDAVGQDANAVAYHGKIIVGLDTENGMLLPYAGHELFHILKQNNSSSTTAKELQSFIIDTLKNDPSYNYDERFNKLQRSYNFDGTDAEIADNINEEMAANACFTVLSNEQNFNSLIKKNKSLAQRVKDFFADFINQIRDRLARLANKNAEYRALQNNLTAQEKIVNMMTAALNEYQKNDTTDNGSVKYALKPYTEKQIANWSNSKNIVIYKSKAQLQQFIDDARNHKNLSEKMYFGIINDETADFIYKKTNVDVHDYNAVLRADSILKIFDSHGNEVNEKKRGQRAIKDEDIILLPQLFGEIDFAEYQGKYTKMHGNNDFINVRSSIEPTITIGLVVQNKQLDIRVQTMYATKKGSNAVVVNTEKQPLPITPQTDNGNASSNITLSQTDTDVNNNSMQDKPKYSLKDNDQSLYEKAIKDNNFKAAQKFVDNAAIQWGALTDDYGNPLRLYHGTTNQEQKSVWNDKTKTFDTDYKKFTVFKNQYDEQSGHFFNSDKDNAGGYGSTLYEVYLKMNKPLIINCNNANYSAISYKGQVKDTYEWAEYAQRKGYDGVIFKNISDGVGYDDLQNITDDYVVFNSSQIKSAETVTYDDKGEVIPLNKRFSFYQDIRFSLKDSDGDELSKQQQEYFKDSKVRDENGNLLVMYHQTNADFTVFNTDNQKAGKFDSEMPTGIFLKPTETDIGLAGKKQMQVYVNITNPIVFFNRANAVIFFEKNIIGYKDAQEEIVRIDREYRQKYDEAELRDDELYKKLFEDFKAKKISSEKFKKGVEDTETKHILDEWTKSSDNARLNAKLLIDSYFAESEYDGMIVESDVGSFGRKVKSYIAFNSNQIKNTDNLNPTNNEDIRFSLRENDTEVKRLLKENAFLQDANDLLRQELQLTKGHVLNQKQVSSVANKLIENHGAYSIDKDLLTKRLGGLYNYIANAGRNLNENYIWSAANDIGKTIAKASSIRDTSFYDEYRALKKRLRETAITVPKSVRDEVSPYANLNKIKIRNNGDIELDSFYTELSRDYPELFDADIINEADQLSRLIEVYESIAPIYTDRISQSGYTMEEYSSIIAAEVFDRYFNVKEVHTFADKKQKELDLLKLHYTTAIEDMKKSYVSRYKAREKELYERIKRTRKQGQERLVKQQAHFNEVSQNAKERKHRTIIKNKIANVKKDLSRRLLNPTETSYVPRSLVQSIANICDLINETEIKDPKNNDRSQNIINELQNLHYNYEQLKNEEDIDYASEYEQEMGTKISLLTKFLKESIGENNGDIVQISQLSLDNLEDIYHILRDIKNTLVDATQQIGLDEKISNHTRGIRIINQLNDTKGMAKAFIGRYEMETLNPIRAVRKITEYNDDAELYKLVNEINLGQRKADKFISDASKPFENLRKDKKAYKKFSEDLVETNIIDKNGNKLQLTENEIVQLIMTVKRRQGKMHLMNGGFILPDRKLHAKGKYKDALSNGTVIRQVNPYTVMDMYDGLSDYAKEWYSASQYLFNEQGKNAINEVSMLLKHKKIAATENYIPLSVDTDYTSKEIEGLKIDSTIEGMGSLKSVAPKAKQPLVIGGLNTVIDKHINDVSRYYGLAIPIRNFNKVYSVQTSSYYDSDMDRISVRTALRDKWGSNGLKLMDNLISDLQTSRSSKGNTFVDEAFSKVQSGFVQATLAGNISVTIKQAASYPTALANLSGKSLAKGLPVFVYKSKHLENLFNEIDEHTGLHYKRRLGMSSQEIGDLTKENAVMSKLPTVINPMKWIQLMDVKTTAALWIASKSEIENNYPDIKVNSEEYWQKVTSLYEDTIENTQPNYDVLHRPELQKTTNKLTKAIIMFKTQPLQNTGILYDSAFELRQKHQEYKQNASAENKQAFDNAKRKFRKAVISQFLAAVTFSAMSLLAATIKHTMYGYRDDNDEVTLSSVLAGLSDSMMSLLATLLAPVGGGELYEGLKSLGDRNANDFVSVPVVTTINDLWGDISDAVGIANGIVQGDKEPADMWSAVENLGYSVAGVLGIPAKNLVKYTKGIIANVKDVVNGDIGKFESGVDRKPAQNVDRYGKYYIDGDSKKSKEILDEMIENKKTEYLADGEKQDEAVKKAKSSVRSSFSSYYKKQYQKAFLKKDGTKRSEITRILSSTGLFVYDNNRTLANVISDWEKEAQEEENKKKK